MRKTFFFAFDCFCISFGFNGLHVRVHIATCTSRKAQRLLREIVHIVLIHERTHVNKIPFYLMNIPTNGKETRANDDVERKTRLNLIVTHRTNRKQNGATALNSGYIHPAATLFLWCRANHPNALQDYCHTRKSKLFGNCSIARTLLADYL